MLCIKSYVRAYFYVLVESTVRIKSKETDWIASQGKFI